MKFGQLIEYYMRNIFLEKLYTKCVGETVPRSFLKNQNCAFLWINSLKFYTVCFCCMSSWGLSKDIDTIWTDLNSSVNTFKRLLTVKISVKSFYSKVKEIHLVAGKQMSFFINLTHGQVKMKSSIKCICTRA